MPGQPSSNHGIALRSALASRIPELQEAARKVIRRALRESSTQVEAAKALDVHVRTLERIRADYPELDG